MSQSSEADGTDFRPFFDMVIGILFVLLILIGALIFFQQARDEEGNGSPADELIRRWRVERDAFLGRLAADLAAEGVPARADPLAVAVLIPLDAVADVARPGGAALDERAVAALGRALEAAVGCVSAPRRPDAACPGADLLTLDRASVQVKVGAHAPDAAVPRPRTARLVEALLSARLLRDAPGLLRASDRGGAPAVAFDAAAPDGQPGAGELAVVFAFARPGP